MGAVGWWARTLTVTLVACLAGARGSWSMRSRSLSILAPTCGWGSLPKVVVFVVPCLWDGPSRGPWGVGPGACGVVFFVCDDRSSWIEGPCAGAPALIGPVATGVGESL